MCISKSGPLFFYFTLFSFFSYNKPTLVTTQNSCICNNENKSKIGLIYLFKQIFNHTSGLKMMVTVRKKFLLLEKTIYNIYLMMLTLVKCLETILLDLFAMKSLCLII